MLDVEVYRLYKGHGARDLMPCLCHDFAVIIAIFTKACHVFLPFFAVIFYCAYACPTPRSPLDVPTAKYDKVKQQY